ncbi:MAG: glycerophosphodiester phosphodiesterase family protein [Chloroflexi bacterium]|nr:glycerophosphodiester phosphodiesterase family protein [Chloroflexota bacterium]
MATDSFNERVTRWDFAPGSLPLPLVIAHRGDVTKAPENTLSSFHAALESGADGIELDVRLTKDEKLVVFHDRHLDRTSNDSGPVNHRVLEEVRALDVGSWFSPGFQGEHPPTLDEVFESLPADFLINVEMKVIMKGMRTIAHKVAEVVQRHARWGSTLVASFNPISLYELKKIDPKINRGYIWSRRHPFPIRSRCFSPMVQADWYDPANDSYNPKLQRKFQERGSRVLAWDLDFGRDMARMTAVGLDGFVTDSLQEMLKQKRELAKAGQQT